MPDTDSMRFPRYQAIPFSSYKEVTDFLRELETACILRGQPSDGTVSFGIASFASLILRPLAAATRRSRDCL